MIQQRITEELLLNNNYQKTTTSSKDEAFVSPGKKVLLWRNITNPLEWIVTVIKVEEVPKRHLIYTGCLKELNGHLKKLRVPTLK